jgi:DNA-binding MarR family transcriptional regulator
MSAAKNKPDCPADQVRRECFAVRLRLLNRVITRIYDDALRPLGVTVNQMNILAVVENMSEAEPGVIGRFLHMEKSTVSRNIERMRRQGWLSAKAGSDARRMVLSATARGRALLAKAMPLWNQGQEQVRELLGEAGIASVKRVADPFFLGAPAC